MTTLRSILDMVVTFLIIHLFGRKDTRLASDAYDDGDAIRRGQFMLSGIRVLMLGGDARQVEMIRAMCEWDAQMTVYGMERATHLEGPSVQLKKDLQDLKKDAEAADVIVLPALSCDEQGVISGPYSDLSLILEDSLLGMIRPETPVFTGTAHPQFRRRCLVRGIRLIELFERDDVAIYNSIPTAEGAVMMAIQETEITLHGARCLVLGMGRTGFTLAALLQAMGADVSVGVRRPDQFARAAERGWKPFHTDDLAGKVSGIDLLFNTIPTMIVTAQIIVRMPVSAVMIDLASKPGGIDFRFAERRGIKARLAPGLPGIVAPVTAGRILANCMHQWLSESPLHTEGSL